MPRGRRKDTVFLAEGQQPEEPDWLYGGTYGAFIKIQQNMDAWAGLDVSAREQIIGRREADGSRTDLPVGTNPHTEGPFANDAMPPATSHVRKAGPRGAVHDQNLILRRGMPYTEAPDGTVLNGLLFVSYQASLGQLDVVLGDWMTNLNFPTLGCGQDALIERGLLTFVNSATFVVPPHDDRFPGAGFFDAPQVPDAKRGRVLLQKAVTDADGNPTRAERGGIEIILIDKQTGQPLGAPLMTNPAGRAVSPRIPIGTTVTVRETQNNRFQPLADFDVTVTAGVVRVDLPNRLQRGANPYGA